MSGVRRALAALLACAALACEQDDDVVAHLSALADAGGAGTAVAPPPALDAGDCTTSALYVLLSSIVRNGCRVPFSESTRAVLGAFFLQQPPPLAPGEARPPSVCDLFGGGVTWFYEMDGEFFLCPSYCEGATVYVRSEDARLLACQGFESN